MIADIEYLTCAETARLLRQALRAAFPDVRFRVRSKTYSGGASITVSWIDGPVPAAVERIARRFEGAEFDGMHDLKTYHTSELDEARRSTGSAWRAINDARRVLCAI